MAAQDGNPSLQGLDESFEQFSEQLWAGWDRLGYFEKVGRVLELALRNLIKWLIKLVIRIATPFGLSIAEGLIEADSELDESVGRLTALAVKDLFGAEIGSGRPKDASPQQVGAAVLRTLTADAVNANGGTLEPSLAPAEKLLGRNLSLGIEGWFKGALAEVGSLGQLETFGGLDDMLAEVLGLGRASRAAMRPIVSALVATPAEWHVNRTYRPNLLSVSEVVRQIVRGRWSREKGFEELARQGWSEDRIEALLNAAAKFHSVADLDLLVRAGERSRETAVQQLRDQGFDETTADTELKLEALKRIASFERAMATTAIDAFADGRIDELTLDEFTRGVTLDNQEGAQLRELAHARRLLRVRPLTSSEARNAVKANVLAVADYRAALRREGRDEPAVLVLELMLRAELDAEKQIAQHRADAEAERQAERDARAAAAAEKKAQLEADRALKRRGSASDLERAVVRGLIPIARYVEVVGASFDADTVDILVGLVEDDRQRFLDQQRKADDAAQRAARKGLDVGALRSAVLQYVISVHEFRQRLTQLGFDGADVDVLADTVAAQLADQEAARADRAKAEAAAKVRRIDLARFELLVRRGVRAMSEYAALLLSLGFDDASRAAMVELLQLRIADDATAAAERQARDAAKRAGELTIDQYRRAVLLGVKTIEDFERFLVTEGVGADVHSLLVAELRDDLAQAEAARVRRTQPSLPGGDRGLTLDTVRRAARLGIITVETYRARLLADGYADDDIAIEIELLLLEIADVQAARKKAADAEPQSVAKNLSLADIARAVRTGFKSLEDYRAAAVTSGLTGDDADTLTRVLGDELRETQAAKVRRAEISSELDARSVSLAGLDEKVKAGALTLDGYETELSQLGYADVDVELLSTLLFDELSS